MENRSIGRAIAGLGMALLIVGIILCLVPNTSNFYIITYTTYPYQGLGIALIISGIVAIVLGGIIMTGAIRPSYQPQQFNPYYQQQAPPPSFQWQQIHQPQVNAASASGAGGHCPNCGAPREAGAFCKHCGAKVG